MGDEGTRSKRKGFIRRGDRTASSGVVRWPEDMPMGDMGTAVYALVPAKGHGEDEFVRCFDVEPVVLMYGESATPSYLDTLFRGEEPSPENPHSAYSDPVLAAVCLGTCGGGSYDAARGRTWECTRDDLTVEGRRLVEALELLYDRPVMLVTLVDT